MPRYHFNVHDGFTRPDPRGRDLPNMNAARQEAVKLAGRILDDDAEHMSFGETWFVEVTDDQGRLLFEFDFRVTEHGTSKA